MNEIVDTNFDHEPIYQKGEWDVLIIIDACRYDLFCEVANDYDYIQTVDSRISPESCTWTWLPSLINRTDDRQLQRTAYITGNPQSDQFLRGDEFGYIDEVWQYGWDEEAGTVLPRSVTDSAISYWRDRCDNVEKMIIHYMQPHTPFIESEDSPVLTHNNFRDGEDISDDWVLAAQGKRDIDSVWNDYRDNLELVLDNLNLLLSNLDGSSVIITSDHGNAVGEYGIYGHPDVRHPALRKVPWVEVDADDEHTYQPTVDRAE